MARTQRSANLDSRTKRLVLQEGKDHAGTLSPGCYLHYYRGGGGKNGTWRARWRNPDTGKIQSAPLGAADDFIPADGVNILDWDQATKKAGDWFRACGRRAHREATGEVISDGPYTVGDAIRDFIAHQEQEGHPTDTIQAYTRARVLPELGDLEAAKLSKPRLQAWLKDLAASPRRRTGKGTSEEGAWAEPPTEDQIRARKVTANRVLAILKRALNLAVEEGRLSPDYTPWREVKPFKKVIRSRVRFLDEQEQRRLVNACPESFRPLVLAALYTGSRYAPLTRMKVGDFNSVAGTVWIARDKGRDGGSSRHVVLDEEGAAWFAGITAGRDSGELMFPRPGVVRLTRKGLAEAWGPQDQDWQMQQACKAAQITPLTFHELRHTYASALVNAGCPLSYVAAQLGHADTRMVERYYGHLAPTDMAKAIRKFSPKRKLTAPTVEPLKIKEA